MMANGQTQIPQRVKKCFKEFFIRALKLLAKEKDQVNVRMRLQLSSPKSTGG